MWSSQKPRILQFLTSIMKVNDISHSQSAELAPFTPTLIVAMDASDLFGSYQNTYLQQFFKHMVCLVSLTLPCGLKGSIGSRPLLRMFHLLCHSSKVLSALSLGSTQTSYSYTFDIQIQYLADMHILLEVCLFSLTSSSTSKIYMLYTVRNAIL